jgi:TctA family transporter
MESEMLTKAIEALIIMSDPTRLAFLAGGVLIGLSLGVIPGLGGLVGMALLLPFTFDMDPFAAFAFLLGMGSVTTTSDTIPAVLFGVPGTTGSAATILDGHPMAKMGQAGRAFGAAYTASMIGGLFGALLLGISIPILRPVMLYLGSPELLAFSIFGLCMVSVLSGGSPLRGLAAAAFGLMIAMIGSDPQTGTLRWTMDSLYLWDGLPLVPVALGTFALPELCDMAIAKRSIAGGNTKVDTRSGQMEGIKDTFRHWWLVIRVAWLGASLGAIPGIGASIVDWVAYGHAARTEKGAAETFGKGDVRGVLASEGSNNAKEGGSLVPTIAFGVPGSASMAILLGAFLIHGLQPGPDMLSKNLDVTYTIIWSVALANVLGTGICFAFSNQFAKLAIIRQPIIMPLILTVIVIGAFQGSRSWGDLYALLFFGVVGWTMKRLRWPRPPIILGVVLGGIVERYMFISIGRYGADWLLNPVVMVMLAISLWGLIRPFMREVQNAGGLKGMFSGFSHPHYDVNTAFYLGFLLLVGVMLNDAQDWPFGAQLVPLIVGYAALIIATISFLNYTFRPVESAAVSEEDEKKTDLMKSMHMDLVSDDDHLERKVVAQRAATFLGWIVGFFVFIGLIGMLPTVFIFVICYMRVEGKEPWRLTLSIATCMTIFAYFVFDYLLSLPWPQSFMGDWFPILRDTIPSM